MVRQSGRPTKDGFMPRTWEEFVAANARTVLSAALRVLGNETDAEDVSQEVFLELFRSGESTDCDISGGLLRTIATRRALDYLRRRRSIAELTGEVASRAAREPADYVMAAELDARLRQELAHLPPRESEVFCLVVFEELSQAEVALLLETTAGAVAKALCLARQRLAAALRMHPVGDTP